MKRFQSPPATKKESPIILLTLALTALLALPASGQSEATAAATGELLQSSNALEISDFEYDFILYGWLAGLKGNTGVGGLPLLSLDIDFSDIPDKLDAVWANTFEIRRGRASFFTDVMYLKLSGSVPTPKGLVFTRTDVEIEQLMLSLMGSYRIFEDDRTTLDLFGGARYVYFKGSISFVPAGMAPPLAASGSQSWWDGISGVRVRHFLTDKLFLNFYGDVGAGDSDLTWQLLGNIGYQVKPNVALAAGYRYLSYDYQSGGFTYDLDTSGPILGLAISF